MIAALTRFVACTCLVGCLIGCESPEENAKRLVRRELKARREAVIDSMRIYRDGLAAYEASDPERSRELFRESVEINERNVYAWMHLGTVEFELDNVFEAAEAFRSACKLARDRYEPHFNLGSVLQSVGKYSKAIEEYKAALELTPDQPEVLENLARCFLATNQRSDEARRLIERALSLEHRPEWIRWLRSQLQLLGEKDSQGEFSS